MPPRWRRHPLGIALVLLLILVVYWQRTDIPAGSDHDRYHEKTFTCVEVVDGDTLDINIRDGQYPDTRIRLWGVDTPEVAGSPAGAMYFGAQASAYTKSLVLGKSVRVVLAPTRTRGKYGRLLAYVYLPDNELMLNEALLENGYAYADRRFDHPWKERFVQLETRARKNQHGLWAGITHEQMPEWRQRYETWRKNR